MKIVKLIISVRFLLTTMQLASQSFNLPDNLHINRIQVIGSHNSYKQAIEPALFKALQTKYSVSMNGLAYNHISLQEQLDMGLRNLEIDVYSDSLGGRYSHPKGLLMATPKEPYNADGVMDKPGFKVFHIPDIDFRSSCPTLEICLEQLKNWSNNHPKHSPIFITMEAKDSEKERSDRTNPEKFTSKTFDILDQTIRKGLGNEKLITPDQVRGNYSSLEEAVINDNWPTLKEAKGKFIFILDQKDRKRDLYIKGHPSLKNRVLFANAEPGTPEAAILIRNNSKNTSEIQHLVKQGYIIRTRADSDTKEARTNDYSSFHAACESGAQIITTDYYKESTWFDSTYKVSFEDKTYFRLNPLF
ncbi:phosphatidylinositol-specific phospholipase C1-like protein [uncultured Bacteroides sp.]|uniref:phosphatidylinositol-specific phospholipase C1-like protein n=1 Tax=uncultured Bacteroides sp. TaxID=162156 RepID=UPI002AA70092|nr:phosphatidylinositol-specific phospholipase C1-like protein [uncultured Bacteroides sp.]